MNSNLLNSQSLTNIWKNISFCSNSKWISWNFLYHIKLHLKKFCKTVFCLYRPALVTQILQPLKNVNMEMQCKTCPTVVLLFRKNNAMPFPIVPLLPQDHKSNLPFQKGWYHSNLKGYAVENRPLAEGNMGSLLTRKRNCVTSQKVALQVHRKLWIING